MRYDLVCPYCKNPFVTYEKTRKHCSEKCRLAWTWQDRFWAKVYKDEVSGCWFWTRAHIQGYGALQINGKAEHAHRLSWLIHRGEIPTGMWVLHRCDCPPCVNPDHLFLGDHLANVADKVAKGRQRGARGERQTTSKLTTAQVLEIRSLYATSEYTHRSLAAQYGVTHSTIGKITIGENWKYV